jgi:predicted kinase
MAWWGDVEYLRVRARQFRELARQYGAKDLAIAAKLPELAVDLEAKAAERDRAAREGAAKGP